MKQILPSLKGLARRLPPFEWLVGYLFGDDVFISYSRHDGDRYGEELAHRLSDAGYSVRMDLWETEPGDRTPEKVMRALRRSRTLVIVATPGAARSSNVADEVDFYKGTHVGKTNVIPIDFGGQVTAAVWFDKVKGVPWLSETGEALAAANPSDPVVKRIREALRFTRRNRRLFKASVASLAAVLLLLGLGAGAGAYALVKVREAAVALSAAAKARDEAEQAQGQARAAREEAESERRAAREAKEAADKQRLEAERQRAEADKQTKLAASANTQREAAERATEEARRLEEQARANAEEQRKVAYSRRLAANADRSMAERPDLGLLLGAEAYAQEPARPTFEARRALLTAFNEYRNLAFILRPEHDPGKHVSQVAATADGRTIVSAGTDGKIVFWDVPSRKQRAAPDAYVTNLTGSLALTPDGEKMATTGGDGKLILWDVRQAEAVRTVGNDEKTEANDEAERHPHYTHVAALNDKTIVAGGADGELVFWDISDAAQPVRLTPPARGDQEEKGPEVNCLSAGRRGTRLATCGEDGVIRLYDVTHVEQPKLLEELKEHRARVEMIAYSPDGRFLASADASGKFLLWRGEGPGSAEPVNAVHVSQEDGVRVQSLAFSADGAHMVVALNNGTIETRLTKSLAKPEPDEQREDRTNTVGRYGPGIMAAAFSADALHVVTGNGDGTVMFWKVNTPGPLAQMFDAHDGNNVSAIVHAPGGRLLASGDDKGVVAITDLADPKSGPSPLAAPAHAGRVTTLAFAPGGRLLASGDEGGRIALWSRDGGGGWVSALLPVEQVKLDERPGPLMHAIANPDAVRLVSFADDGRSLVSVGPGAQVVLWDVEGRRRSRTVPLPDRDSDGRRLLLLGTAASRDGRKLALGYEDGSLYLLDTRDERAALQPLRGHTERVINLAFSGDGRHLVSLDESGAGFIWDLSAAPRQCREFRLRPLRENPAATYTSGIKAVSFDRGDQTLALAGSGEVIIWDLESNSPIGSIIDARVGDNVSFSPEGDTLASGGRGVITLLDMNPAKWAEQAREIANRPLAPWERALFTSGGGAGCASPPGPNPPRVREDRRARSPKGAGQSLLGRGTR